MQCRGLAFCCGRLVLCFKTPPPLQGGVRGGLVFPRFQPLTQPLPRGERSFESKPSGVSQLKNTVCGLESRGSFREPNVRIAERSATIRRRHLTRLPQAADRFFEDQGAYNLDRW
jgi:hypothetical protein